MEAKNRYDRFYIARYMRGTRRRKRRAFLKANKLKRFKPHLGLIDIVFFASREARSEKILNFEADKKIEQEKLLEAKEKVVQQKKKKKYWSFIFLLVNIGVISAILIDQANQQGFTSYQDLLQGVANFNFIYLAILGFPLLTFIDWGKFQLLLYKAIGRSRHYLSYKVSAIGRYYDLVTPLGTGGQPFQVYYLNKRGVKGQIATSVPLAKYIFSQITFVTFAIIALATNSAAQGNNAIVVTAAWIGLILNIFLLCGVFVLSVSTKIGPKVTISILKFLSKIRIVKNYELAFKKVMRFVREYQKSMRYFTSNILVVLLSLLLSAAYILVQGTIPFLIYSAFNPFDATMWWTILSKLVILEFAVSFIPLPGGGGASELSFAAMFSTWFEGTFFWAILIWRLIVYYAFILQGFVVIIYDMIIGDKKAARLKKIGYWEEFAKNSWFNRFKRKKGKEKKIDKSKIKE
jgi:glycosyltransferase 2 family protein